MGRDAFILPEMPSSWRDLPVSPANVPLWSDVTVMMTILPETWPPQC
ncbi:hypothetical protein CES86_1851 [Brucella lupini]|uniref:Uncharacterized protein n=1 Tax=Brucella lupini TaxID=255457 RepID=A0A256GUU9_9HYPH|nr:hypothetical protein CES86_1851 [Brucella lupini]